ncbi:MAG: 6-oxocyclohex-1-ene-1-carbonyl-CoA hydratase [Deltaproteobacteria bacterium]|nr:6-oxocyclohex-1-ene-1-carbonyl-CoA hydratase [Deltaproteobacteria bacterium]MBW1961950.1 6-oxocyclohex-1-ene-1-carbonyl-CoA hydratase [Deltaproteobacteria bacterium]MBW2151185.1 6-oxocyclohex-1-ene-1-carbonyl-CoA hydratase [Deltaproteobacteria bacterium]
MSNLDWLPRESGKKDHFLWGDEHFSDKPPGVIFEKRPILDPSGNPVQGLYSAWIILNNPEQYNSYTTEMVKGVISGFQRASSDSSVVAAVFTGAGDRAFCTGGNTKEYAEYYAGRPSEYGAYMDLFNAMVDAILGCKKPTICRVNGMRVAGGQEIGMACDISLSSDLAVFGQAGPRHGSAPDGGSSDFLPWMLPLELAMWNCVSCEFWSAYKMKRLGLISNCVPVIKDNGKWVRNPAVITDTFLEDGEIVFGEFVTGDKAKRAREYVKTATVDFERLDAEVNKVLWTFTNLFPGCLIKSVDGIRLKKKFFWDQAKVINRHWLAVNMATEAYLGFNAFNTRKLTGKDTIDFIEYRRRQAAGAAFDAEFMTAVLAKPVK